MHPYAAHRRTKSAITAAWASAIAILFAAVAAVSFAVDQSVTLSLPAPPPAGSTGR